MTDLIIDWDSLPTCGEELVVSPYICVDGEQYYPEPTPVPVPATIFLMAPLLAVLLFKRRNGR